MSTIKLQNNIIRKVLNIKNSQLLEYLHALVSKEQEAEGYRLSKFEKQVVNESLADYQSGNTMSSEDVFAKTDKWLEE